MERSDVISDVFLLITAFIWGVTIVYQKLGMEFMGPYYFNGLRFLLGAICLIPILLFSLYKRKRATNSKKILNKNVILGGFLMGVVLFIGVSLQQIGLMGTPVGHAGFLTSLYVIWVPILGCCMGNKLRLNAWFAVFCALLGLYFMSVKGDVIDNSESFSISKSNIIILISSIFWAIHVLCVDYLTSRHSSVLLAFLQLLICSLLSFVFAFCFEDMSWALVKLAAVPLFYAGVVAAGVGYTLQVIAQKKAPPHHASIILNFEAVFAVLGGVVLLNESITLNVFIGFSLMFIGMFICHVDIFNWKFLRTNKCNE